MNRFPPEKSEIRAASTWYWWLWLSPLVTVPLLFSSAAAISLPYPLSEVAPVFISALPHLVLLIPARDTRRPFVRWHGRQMLLLAGLRTALPLVALGLYGGEWLVALLFLLALLAVWFIGTLWGQIQARHGRCSLARWFGIEFSTLPEKPIPVVEPAKTAGHFVRDLSAETDPHKREGLCRLWLNQVIGLPEREKLDVLEAVLRFSLSVKQRRLALSMLERLGAVEPL